MRDTKVLHMRVEWFAEHYPGEPYHALLCDPPYELGFMGKSWDDTGVAYRPDTWAALAEHLYPGAFGMAFASSRGWHRLAVAIEDAGLIIHPSIFGWATGQGFPKATRIDTQVDRDAGALDEREEYERPVAYPDSDTWSVPNKNMPSTTHFWGNTKSERNKGGFNTDTHAATDLARAWEGHRYGLQALKPALEPIIVFQKPYEGRPVDDITATGAGALNIDGGRVAYQSDADYRKNADFDRHTKGSMFVGVGKALRGDRSGRWPANLILTDPGAAAALDAQSGELAGRGNIGPTKRGQQAGVAYYVGDKATDAPHWHDNKGGGASRFFYNVRRQLDAADPVCYTAKASRSEREAGLETFGRTTVDDGRNKSIDNPYLRGETKRRNTHPTVKPLDLARYLATLLLPPDEYAPRRLLVPFSGSGSEMIGAWQAGWEHVTGIEFTREYVEIARARLEYWKRIGVQTDFIDDLF